MAKDVAEILGYGKAETMTRRLDDDEKDTTICSTPGGPQEVTVINESGLYHALLGSEQPKAIAFRKWVTGEVLPSLRKHEVFEHQEFWQIRIVEINGEPWFVAKDVATALGYTDTDKAIRNHCKYSKLFKPADLSGLEIGPRGYDLDLP